MQLGFFPRLTVRHTSNETEGQIYLPMVNWVLALACIALVVFFQASSRLAAAYGLAVSGTMAVTSIVFFLVIRHAWGWSAWKAGALLLFFLALDLPFLFANGLKFLHGGYLPFTIGAACALVMASWRIGSGLLAARAAAAAKPVEAFLAELPARTLARMPGVGVWMVSLTDGIPATLVLAFERFRVLHETVVLLSVVTEHVPFIEARKRVSHVKPLGQGLVRAIVHYGFMERPNVPVVLSDVFRRAGRPGHPKDVIYFMGRETVVPGPRGRMNRLLEAVYAFLRRNARNPTDHFRLPPWQVVEVGTQLDL
jgi:KUP system potassium uptake protein